MPLRSMSSPLTITIPRKKYSVVLYRDHRELAVEIRNSAGLPIRRVSLGTSLAATRRAFQAILQGTGQVEPIYPSPTRHAGRHIQVVRRENGLFLLPVTNRGKPLLKKSLYLDKTVVQQLFEELTQRYTPIDLLLPMKALQRAFFAALAVARSDKDLEQQTRTQLRTLGYTVPPTYDQQKGQVWTIRPGQRSRSIYFDALAFSTRQVVFVENKFHQERVPTLEIENFVERLQIVGPWVGARQVVAAFVSDSVISKDGYALLQNGQGHFYDELVLCVKRFKG